MAMNERYRAFSQRLVSETERFLTWRRVRKHRKLERLKQKSVILDWVEAFLWAALVVLLINQYLLQAYQIPTGSMKDTLLVQDRVFVDKLVFGPELIPGMAKLPGFREPQRNEVVIFENPAYVSRGPAFEVLQRVIYMLTLSMVDIDRDEHGMPRAQFLIKRAVGVGHDRFRLRDGELQILPQGEDGWMSEAAFQDKAEISYPVNRMLDPEDYPAIRGGAVVSAYRDLGIGPPSFAREAMSELRTVGYPDAIYFNKWRERTQLMAQPHDRSTRHAALRHENGWYIPENGMLMLGDNRDNSLDGRNFGPVDAGRVLGRGMIKYWPLNRFGPIE